MELKIFSNWFAPKLKNDTKMIHGIYNKECNFRCVFCSQSKREEYQGYRNFDLKEYENEVVKLMCESDMFKFTGGEPTMLPELYDMLRIVKKHNGKNLLDTNASRSDLVKKMIDEGLVDVLGVSIKGLTLEEAIKKSGNRNRKLCWDNVLEVCNYSYGKVNVILTYVVDSNLNMNDLRMFCKSISEGTVKVDYLKLNSLYGTNLPDKSLNPLDESSFIKICNDIVEEYPQLVGRLIVIPNSDAVRNKESILYF